MHLASLEHHFWGGHAIVGGHIPVAVGMALAHQYTGSDRVVVCIFGDGSVNTGAFHEAMNLAGVWRLPVVFIASNNLYGMGTAIERSSAVTEIYKRAAAYNMPGKRINGNDVLEVEAEVHDAVERIRAGEGPRLIEAMTYRFRGHSTADPELYRSKEEVAEWRARDPIFFFRRWVVAKGIATDGRIRTPSTRKWNKSSKMPPSSRTKAPSRIRTRCTITSTPTRKAGRQSHMAEITYREALRQALREEMLRDERVFLLGEDIGSIRRLLRGNERAAGRVRRKASPGHAYF